MLTAFALVPLALKLAMILSGVPLVVAVLTNDWTPLAADVKSQRAHPPKRLPGLPRPSVRPLSVPDEGADRTTPFPELFAPKHTTKSALPDAELEEQVCGLADAEIPFPSAVGADP